MKSLLYFFIYLLISDLSPQTNQDKTFYEDGYTYQCNATEGAGFVNLYNKDSKYIEKQIIINWSHNCENSASILFL